MTDNRSNMPNYREVFGQDDEDDSDAEYDDRPARSSTDIKRYDQEVLDEEEENEKLLQAGAGVREVTYNAWAGDGEGERSGKRGNGRGRTDTGEERKKLMQRMEEGTALERSESSDGSLDFENEKVREVPVERSKKSKFWRTCRRTTLYTVVGALFIAIGAGAWRATRIDAAHLSTSVGDEDELLRVASALNGTLKNMTSSARPLYTDLAQPDKNESQTGAAGETYWLKTGTTKLKSNGTSLFAPTTILISLDGFRADFLQRELTPTLNDFIKNGVSPKYMTPSFPSVTFPNHFTLVTGLYPECHGVVGNTFWDPELQEEFSYHDQAHSMQPKWWDGEPLWVTAEDQGVRTATHMWPGSEAHLGDIEPAFVDKYNGSELLDSKVDRIMELLDKPGPEDIITASEDDEERPQLILAYVPNVDSDGHRFGPNSTHIRRTIRAVDTMLQSILDGLKARNLEDIVNVVVVSDHGMATTSTTRLLQLEDMIDTSIIEHIDGWPHYGLRPYDDSKIDMLHARLLTQTAHRDGFDVYLRDKTMPERYHFSNNPRIAPLWIIPKTGWAIVTKEDFNVEEALQSGRVFHPKGVHGYDHEHPLMRAIFVARGPAFPHTPGSKVDVFQNTEVYNIVCDSVGIEPRPNNGTLRLPLRPVGLHSDDDVVEQGGIFADPPVTSFVPQIATAVGDVLSPTAVATESVGFLSAVVSAVTAATAVTEGFEAVKTAAVDDLDAAATAVDNSLETARPVETGIAELADVDDEDVVDDLGNPITDEPNSEATNPNGAVDDYDYANSAVDDAADDDDLVDEEDVVDDDDRVDDKEAVNSEDASDEPTTVQQEPDVLLHDEDELSDEGKAYLENVHSAAAPVAASTPEPVAEVGIVDDEEESEDDDEDVKDGGVEDDDDDDDDDGVEEEDDDLPAAVRPADTETDPATADVAPTTPLPKPQAAAEEEDEEEEEQKGWGSWLTSTFSGVKNWVGGLFGGGGDADDEGARRRV